MREEETEESIHEFDGNNNSIFLQKDQNKTVHFEANKNLNGTSKAKTKKKEHPIIPKIDIQKKTITIWTPNLERNEVNIAENSVKH